ncbi:MAG: SPOR domain-containing protein [Candidatus Krumholzibacteriia bacterium]
MSADTPDLKVAGLDVLTTGLNLAELDLHGGEGLWDEVARFAKESRLEALVDRCMDGRSAPRIWALLEAPAGGPAAAAAGLGIARVLADRGQAVVLLDGDEQEPRLTRWVGRTEQEGWIDMVRFGASLYASSAPLPSDNRRGSVLGVGSFAPTGVTPDEVADLLGRLRHQADDLVMVLPAKLRSQPWLEGANIRLLCWDLLGRSDADTRTIVSELERMGAGPSHLLGFGVEEFAAINDRLSEESLAGPTRAESDAATTPPADSVPADPGLPDADAADETPVDDDLEDAADDAPPEEMADSTPVATDAPDEPREASAETDPQRRRSSGIFVFVAAAAFVCLALLGWFVVGQLRGPQTPPREVAAAGGSSVRPTLPDASEPAVVDETPGQMEVPPAEATGDAGPAGEPVAGEPGETAADEPPAVAGPAGGGGVTPPGHAGAEPTVARPQTPPAEAEPAAPQPADAPPAAFDPTPFREPVGAAGWALWVYSLPDEATADREIRELDRRGLRAVARAVEIKDRGRWYRIYTGSFATRDEARTAAVGLKAYLREDWVVPARF